MSVPHELSLENWTQRSTICCNSLTRNTKLFIFALLQMMKNSHQQKTKEMVDIKKCEANARTETRNPSKVCPCFVLGGIRNMASITSYLFIEGPFHRKSPSLVYRKVVFLQHDNAGEPNPRKVRLLGGVLSLPAPWQTGLLPRDLHVCW